MKILGFFFFFSLSLLAGPIRIEQEISRCNCKGMKVTASAQHLVYNDGIEIAMYGTRAELTMKVSGYGEKKTSNNGTDSVSATTFASFTAPSPGWYSSFGYHKGLEYRKNDLVPFPPLPPVEITTDAQCEAKEEEEEDIPDPLPCH